MSRKMDPNTVNKIIHTRSVIRKKYAALKEGRSEAEVGLEKVFQPITTPLKKLTVLPQQIQQLPDALAGKLKKEKHEPHASFHTTFTPSDKFSKRESSSLDDEAASSPLSEPDLSLQDYSNTSLDTLEYSTNKFMESMKLDNNYDSKYGPYYDSKELAWKIGDSSFAVIDSNVVVDGKTYSLTPGLRELIFFRHPSEKLYTEDDIESYLDIVKTSGALHRNYNKSLQYAGNKSHKYKLIMNLLKRKEFLPHTGTGLMKYSKNKLDYVYWNDPNELVNRLKLLLSSQEAGHNNHTNEITSILEELREAHIIV